MTRIVVPVEPNPKPAILVSGLPIDASYTVAKRSKVEIPFIVEQPGGYVYMDTITYDVSVPMTDQVVAAMIVARYTEWRTVMDTPAPKPTKKWLTNELARVQREKKTIESRVAQLTADIAQMDAVPAAGDRVPSR